MNGFSFEWTVKLGDVLTVLGALCVAAAFLYRRGGEDAEMQITLKRLTDQFAELRTEFKGFGDTLKKVAIQEMQIGLLMKWYDELRRGIGKIE